MNECNNINNINAYEEVTSMSKELHNTSKTETVSKRCISCEHEYDMPLTEKCKVVSHKVVIQKNNTNHQCKSLSILAVMVMAFMKIIIFKPFRACEEMHWKKAYDDAQNDESCDVNMLKCTALKMITMISIKLRRLGSKAKRFIT